MEVVLEDETVLKAWGIGLENLQENCIYCKTPTRYWAKSINKPVCKCCAAKRTKQGVLK